MSSPAEDAEATPIKRGRHRFIAGLGIGQICSWGSLYYSFPLIAEAMAPELGYSKPALYGAATLGLLISGLAAYPVGAAIDRGHGRWIMGGGALLAGLMLLAWSLVEGLLPFYLVVAGIGLAQAATLYEPAFAVIARRFGPVNARRGITSLTLWGGFAGTVFIPLIQVMVDGIGWRGAVAVLGGVNIVICAGLYVALIGKSADHVAPSSAASAGAPAQAAADRAALRMALRSPVFWSLAVSFIGYAAIFSTLGYHFYPLLIERGLDTAHVIMALAVIGPAQVAARVAVWALGPNASVRRIGSLTVLAFPIALGALAAIPPEFFLVVLILLFHGAANGIMTIVRGLAVPEMLSRHAYGAINGALTAPAMLSRAFAPVIVAMLWEASGSYQAVLVALVICSFLVAGGFWTAALLTRPRYPGNRPDTV